MMSEDFGASILCLFLSIPFGILAYLRGKCLNYMFIARKYSKVFLNSSKPFIDISDLPSYAYRDYTYMTNPELRNNILKQNIEGALKYGYLKNCTIEIHNGICQIALEKKIVKDMCPSCGAPIVGVEDDTYVCEYCGNKIFDVVKKK